MHAGARVGVNSGSAWERKASECVCTHMGVCVCVYLCGCVCPRVFAHKCLGLLGSQGLEGPGVDFPPRHPRCVVIQSLLCLFRGRSFFLSGGRLFHLHILLAVRKFFL